MLVEQSIAVCVHGLSLFVPANISFNSVLISIIHHHVRVCATEMDPDVVCGIVVDR